jgi:hypothetical protein
VRQYGSSAASQRSNAIKFAARTTSHVQLKGAFLFNIQHEVDLGCGGDEMARYQLRIEKTLEEVIPKTIPRVGDGTRSQLLIVQVDLRPGQRQWLELRVFPDSAVLNTEALNDELDVTLIPPPVASPFRFQLFFALWGYEADDYLGTALNGCEIFDG